MSDQEPKKVHSEPPPATDEIDQDWSAIPPEVGAKGSASLSSATSHASAASPPRHEEEDDDDDEEEEDEDEDEEDDEDEDAHAAREPAARAEEPDSGDWIPDWAPWTVLGGLVVVALLGGLGALGEVAVPRPTAALAAESAAEPTEAAPSAAEEAPQTVVASHLLVAYQGAERVSPTVTRSKAEARLRAQEALAKAKQGTPFATLVAEYSDEPGAAARQGSLGRFPREAMVKPFADAAFALKPGGISGIVETQFGYHVIQRNQ